jgi:hypothetical protein
MAEEWNMTEGELVLNVNNLAGVNLHCSITGGALDGRRVGDFVTMAFTAKTYWHRNFLERSLVAARTIYLWENNKFSL